jgi:F0F1-type ATP synthase assembly protein I
MAQSGCLVVVMVLGSLAAGLFLDRMFNSRPLLTLLLVLGSVPVTLFLLFRIAMRVIAADRQEPARGEKDRHDRQDET